MLESLPDAASLSMVLTGAFIAGFVTGFAGFGTGLVSSGLWFHALPAPMVPPLVALASVAAQIVGLATVRQAFEWRRALPYLIGGFAGVPLGVAALKFATPETLRFSVGGFLVAYAAFQLSGVGRLRIATWGGRPSDGIIGAGGGFLGGFAGLSGPLPLVWLQMRGGTSAEQRATYQPFNLIVLVAASVGMSATGAIDGGVLAVAALCLPVTVIGAWIGARVYTGVSETAFRGIVLVLLLVSGLILVVQGIA
ncbi:MAG: sulfite exporter TauE/SafE family protein [Alphaproteobacteria bacterium]|nr:sulfite exporter TauE/SafE family protein [Alphaproteobacteria bacterium]